MTNEHLFEDLKQFVSATVSQSEESIKKELSRLDKRIDGFDEKLDLIQDAIADTVQDQGRRIEDHEKRLHRLETRAASSL